MAQCQGTTRKGERCKREAAEGSAYCSIHTDQDAAREPVVKTAIGFALVGAILFFRLRR